MQQLITILHILVALSVIILVLLQQGKGADMGAALGSGASGTMFGSQGATPFLVKLTAGLAFVFFITCGVLSYFASKSLEQSQGMLTPVPVPTSAVPAPTTIMPPVNPALPPNPSK